MLELVTCFSMGVFILGVEAGILDRSLDHTGNEHLSIHVRHWVVWSAEYVDVSAMTGELGVLGTACAAYRKITTPRADDGISNQGRAA